MIDIQIGDNGLVVSSCIRSEVNLFNNFDVLSEEEKKKTIKVMNKNLYKENKEQKICSHCYKLLKLSDFNREKKGSFGLKAFCRHCEVNKNRHMYLKRIGKQKETKK